ncbi:MAG TPA: hypothetical protein VKA27_06680 [Sunxiuqinia sp.]|nr:hypothetical protein [Sunxiuqinia sp.]
MLDCVYNQNVDRGAGGTTIAGNDPGESVFGKHKAITIKVAVLDIYQGMFG